ncbi:MAG: O-antigen ligase family protein [Planctomycetaceae bacterium]|nr:O-antigen ligase family protein [Planctomycetaceae bacterium]
MTLLDAWKRQQFANTSALQGKAEKTPTSPAETAEIAALGISAATLLGVPWLLGGFIPHARFLLTLGGVIATLLLLMARFLHSRLPEGEGTTRTLTPMPAAVLLFCGMATVGVIQLLPVFTPAVHAMDHAAIRDRVSLLPTSYSMNSPRTVSPADTRLAICQYIGLALICGVVAETIGQSRRRLTGFLSSQVAGACAVTIAGWLSLFDEQPLGIASQWMVGNTIPFGPFVNPNNAAGWLAVNLGFALCLIVLMFDEKIDKPKRSYNFERGFREFVARQIERLQGRLSALSIHQILATIGFIVVITGIGSTLSRAGILGALFGLVVAALTRLKLSNITFSIIASAALVVVAGGVLSLLEFDDEVVRELATLENPVDESAGRFDHWSDSLKAVADFPVLGLGLGAYRMANQPYVNHDTGKWFQKADNQLVEAIVEGGLVGFVLFAALGLLGLRLTLRLTRRSLAVSSKRRPFFVSLSLMTAVATGALAFTAFFDYATGLPATAGAFAATLGIAAARYAKDSDAGQFRTKRSARRHSRKRRGSADGSRMAKTAEHQTDPVLATAETPPQAEASAPSSQHRRIHQRTVRRSTWVYLLLLIAAFPFLKDAWAATRLYPLIVETTHLLRKPDHSDAGLRSVALLTNLTSAVRSRPDDPDGLDTIARLKEFAFRHALLKKLHPEPFPVEREFQTVWTALSPPELAARMTRMRMASPDDAKRLQSIMDDVRREFPWPDDTRNAFRTSPFYPGTATSQLFAVAIFPESSTRPNDLQLRSQAVLLYEPGSARRLFQTGRIWFEKGDLATANPFWRRSLELSPAFQTQILNYAANRLSPARTLDEYGPTSYFKAVHAATTIRNQDVKRLLWQRADELWAAELAGDPSPSIIAARATHLAEQISASAAIDWLTERAKDVQGNLPLMKQEARLLETSGQSSRALLQWYRIEGISGDPEAIREIGRLQKLSRENNE